MSDKGKTSINCLGGSTGPVGLLGVAFVVLKLCNVIDWSWWLVLLPFWGSALLGLTIFFVAIIILVIAALCGADLD